MGTRQMIVTRDVTESAYVDVPDGINWDWACAEALELAKALPADAWAVDEGQRSTPYVTSECFQ